MGRPLKSLYSAKPFTHSIRTLVWATVLLENAFLSTPAQAGPATKRRRLWLVRNMTRPMFASRPPGGAEPQSADPRRTTTVRFPGGVATDIGSSLPGSFGTGSRAPAAAG
jgi:hypothetical protein